MVPDDTKGKFPVLRQPASGIPAVTDTPEGLLEAVSSLLGGTGPVAIDTERAQGFRYDSCARLVQIKRRGAGIFLIDTMALPDLSSLAPALQAPWIFHAPGGDLGPLADVGLVPPSLFDTEIAARLLGVESFSLRGVCEAILGVTIDKAHQNEDWSLRPLPKDWLRYAALDVELLPELCEQLSEQLMSLGRLEWANQEFEYERLHPQVSRPSSWRNIKHLAKVRSEEGLAVAKELWIARDSLGKQLDIAPSRLLASSGIIEAALVRPSTRRKLQSIAEFRRPKAREYTDIWLRAVRRAVNTPALELPKKATQTRKDGLPAARSWKRLNPAAHERLQVVREVVAGVADEVGISPDIVLEPRVQRQVTWTNSPITSQALLDAGARPWQVDLVTTPLRLVSCN